MLIDEVQAAQWFGRGRALSARGAFDEAEQCFRQALEIKPRWGKSYYNLSQGGFCTAADIAEMRTIAADASEPSIERVAAGFGLGKHFDDAGDYREAFQHYTKANVLYKSTQGATFSADRLRQAVDSIISRHTRQSFAKQSGSLSEAPVFIVGMPRQGSSLVEQILSSHPSVHGAGELNHIGQVIADGEPLAEVANTRAEWLHNLAPHAERILDKQLNNIFHLAQIAMLFPHARIILCLRDARDTCLSCFFSLFGDNGPLFSYDLSDCATYFREMQRLATHWRQVLPLRILEVQYEALVGNLEGLSRRMIAFLGLDWDPACLDFHETQRTVWTLSKWQVRQPLYTRSVRRWQHYAQELAEVQGLPGRQIAARAYANGTTR